MLDKKGYNRNKKEKKTLYDNDENIIETVTLGSAVIDPQMIEILKDLPRDYLFKIKRIGINKIGINESVKNQNNAYYRERDNTIMLSKELLNDKFTLAHKFGHALDTKLLNNLNKNAEYQKIYQEELAQYKAVTIDTEGHLIDSFRTEQ